MADDLLAGYFECFGTSIERQRRTRNINSFRVECLNRLRDCPLLCGELRRRASNSLMRYSDNSIRRADTHRKTVDISKKSGECSPLACHFPVRYYNKSPCRADLYNRRQDIFSFWIEFCRWRLIAVLHIFQTAVSLVRNYAGRLIFWSEAVRFTVSQRYLCGISGELPFSDISRFSSQDSRKTILIACTLHVVIIFRGFGSANSLAERVFIFAVRDPQIGSSQGVISRIAWACDCLLDRAI